MKGFWQNDPGTIFMRHQEFWPAQCVRMDRVGRYMDIIYHVWYVHARHQKSIYYAENVHFTNKMVNRACLSVHTGTILGQANHIFMKFRRFILVPQTKILICALYPNIRTSQICKLEIYWNIAIFLHFFTGKCDQNLVRKLIWISFDKFLWQISFDNFLW